MRHMLLAFLVSLCTYAVGQHSAVTRQIATNHDTTYLLVTTGDRAINGGHCSGTAIGPHALLTATHCEEPTDKIKIDDEDATIDGRLRDNYDHTIYLVSDFNFPSWSEVSQRELVVGERLYLFGNPGRFRDIYREGYVAGTENYKGDEMATIDLNGFFGDSGAAYFDKSGKIVAVVNNYASESRDEDRFHLMTVYALHFSAAQLKKALTY